MRQKTAFLLVATVAVCSIATSFMRTSNRPPVFHKKTYSNAHIEFKTNIESIKSPKGLKSWGINDDDKYVIILTLENLTQNDLVVLTAPFLHSLRMDLRDHKNRRIPLSENGTKVVQAGASRNNIGGGLLSANQTSARYYELSRFFQVQEPGKYLIQIEFDYRPHHQTGLRNYRSEQFEVTFQ